MTARGNRDELVIRKYFESMGYNVEIARVSKGHFDRIAWKESTASASGFIRFFVQSKRNGRPEADFFTRPDPIYMTSSHERVWVTHWTTGKRRGTWVFYYSYGEEEEYTTGELGG
jgi:hypothetical protein